jgi:hypothetical protein
MVRINNKTGRNDTVPILHGAILWNRLLCGRVVLELRPVDNLECIFVEYRICVIEDHPQSLMVFQISKDMKQLLQVPFMRRQNNIA